jgi:hypothetical protein
MLKETPVLKGRRKHAPTLSFYCQSSTGANYRLPSFIE